MAVVLRESFSVAAPIEAVWAFFMAPERVAACMPGAQLDEAVDDSTYQGSIRVKVGAVTTSYKGRVQFVSVNEAGRSVELLAEGRETGGGTALGKMSSRLRSGENGNTEVLVEASVELTGRIAQMGRGMIQGVSQQLFQQFAAEAKAQLEAPAGSVVEPRKTEAISILPLILRVMWQSMVRFVRRLLARPAR